MTPVLYEWVPSKANISDLPSRSEAEWSAEDADVMGELRSRPGYQGPPRALEWPTLGELSDFRQMARRIRATAATVVRARAV